MTPCIACGAPDSFYDRVTVEGDVATFTLQLNTGRVCRACYDRARTELRPVLDKSSETASAFFVPV